jgi:hypothetical protein
LFFSFFFFCDMFRTITMVEPNTVSPMHPPARCCVTCIYTTQCTHTHRHQPSFLRPFFLSFIVSLSLDDLTTISRRVLITGASSS